MHQSKLEDIGNQLKNLKIVVDEAKLQLKNGCDSISELVASLL